MDQRMSRRTSLDLAQANKIATLKVALAVPELPQRRVGRAGEEHIAHCKLSENVLGRVEKAWTHPCGSRTCSTGVRMMKCLCA
jgi:hypothetical protein